MYTFSIGDTVGMDEDELVVVTHPEALRIEARPIDHESVPDGSVGLGYFYDGRLVARGVVTPDAVEALDSLLRAPVTVAIAATEDEDGNIDGRFCLVLTIDPEKLEREEEESGEEPWRQSVPTPPPTFSEAFDSAGDSEDEDRPHMALLPLGNVVRSARDRKHPDAVEDDAREMLDNLLGGLAKDAVSKAIDDLLDSL